MIMLGGVFNRDENTFYGDLTLSALERLHAGKGFIFPSAVSIENGITDYNYDLALVQKAIFRSADRIFVLADSNKFEKKRYAENKRHRDGYDLCYRPGA